MKKTILLSLVLLFIPVILYGQDKVEAPVWSMGDKWTYKDVTGSTFTNEIVRIEEDLFIMKTQGVQYLFGYDKKTLNNKFLIEEGGRKMKDTTNYRKIFDFPLFVGKKWSYTSTGRAAGAVGNVEVTFLNELMVDGTEDVTTPVKKFKTYRIYYKQTNMGAGKSGWMHLWYSPEAKAWVKREYEKGPFWSLVSSRDSELISYELK